MQTNFFLVQKIVLKILFILVVTSFTVSGSVKQIRFVIYDIHTRNSNFPVHCALCYIQGKSEKVNHVKM